MSDLHSFSLIDVQKKSFNKFLFDDSVSSASLYNIFKNTFPISDAFGNVSISFVDYRIEQPKLTEEECRAKSLTYQIDVYIKVRITVYDVNPDDGTADIKNIKEQEVYLCSVPYMTENATFVVNGYERVVVSQIHRSPGVFFSREVVDLVPVYSANIIPYRGSWLNIYFDSKDILYFKIDKKKKIPIHNLLKALTLSDADVINYFYKDIELSYVKDQDAWEVKLDFDSINQSYAQFDVYDEANSLIVEKHDLIKKSTVKKFKSGKCFVKTEDLKGSFLFSELDINGNKNEVADIVSDKEIENLKEQPNGFIFHVINQMDQSYIPNIHSSLVSGRGIDSSSALINIFKTLNPGDLISAADAEKSFHKLFFAPEYYNLFAVGRHIMNSSLDIKDVPETLTTLRKEDILLILN